MVTVYVLKLAGGKFYVGKTSRDDVEARVKEHSAGRGAGSVWTAKHSVIQLECSYPNKDDVRSIYHQPHPHKCAPIPLPTFHIF